MPVLDGTVRPIRPDDLPAPALRAAPAWAPQLDERLRGILLIIGATVLFSTSDATAKYVTRTLPVIELAWVRYFVFAVAAAVMALRQRRDLPRTRRPWQQLLRGVTILASALLFLVGLRVLPMADAAAINFISPLLITALAVPFLGETVRLGRWIALGFGLFGAVLAAQPGSGAFQLAAIFPALSALAWAFAMVLTRGFAATERPVTTLLWTAVSGLILLSLILPLDARMPTGREMLLSLLVGVVASGGQFLVILAYQSAPASLLAPFSYMQLIWSTLAGYLVFNSVPSSATLAGAAVIAGSGLYSARRERART